jgi:hypothetical protein
MNSGIIRKALTTTLALELEYREPFVVRELEPSASGLHNFNSHDDCLTIEFAYLLSVI